MLMPSPPTPFDPRHACIGVTRADTDTHLVWRPGRGARGLSCWIALPPNVASSLDTEARPLVAVHGIHRGARAQAKGFAARAGIQQRIVIAPLFDAEAWPRYQQVVRKGRADIALLELLRDLHVYGLVPTERVDLFGYSGGAQFAHRFAMLHPQRVGRLTLSSAGWYTAPDDGAFPYGLGPGTGGDSAWGPRLAARLDEFLRLPITVAVGARDDVVDQNTRSNKVLDQTQGRTRVERAARWVAALDRAARARGLSDPDLRHELLPGCGHDFNDCLTRGGLAALVLPDSAN